MKKKLSILLVATMALSMVPTVAFADSTNTVSNVKMFKKDADNVNLGNLTIKQEGATTADKQIAGLWYEDFGGDIVLNFENAKFKSDTYLALNNPLDVDKAAATAAGRVYYTKMSDTKLGVSLPENPGVGGHVASNNAAVIYHNIPLFAKTGSSEGDIKVTVDRLDTQVTATTSTVGVVAAGSTVSTVGTVKDLVVGESVTLDSVVITETALAAKKINKVELVAPKGFYWSTTSNVNLSTLGGYAGTATTRPVYSKYGSTTDSRTPIYEIVDMNGDGDTNDIIGYIGSGVTTAKNDMEVITLELDNSALTSPVANLAGSGFSTSSSTSTNRGVLVISGLVLNAETDATLGDVAITVKGDPTEQTLTVAKAIDYGYTVEAATAKAIISGAYDADYTSSRQETAKVTIKEGTTNSWWLERATTFNFPEGVKVRGYKIKTSDMANSIGENKINLLDNNGKYVYANAAGDVTVKASEDYDKVTISGLKRDTTVGSTKKAKMEITFYVSVAADYEGDINVTVDGSVDKTDKLIATTQQALDVTFDTKNVGVALQDVATGDITIKENAKGVLNKTGKLQIAIDDVNSIKFVNDGKVEAIVADGDIEISKAYVKSNILTLEVKRASTKPSTITVKGLVATLDRTPAEGPYALKVYGDSFLQNGPTNNAKDDQFEYANYIEFKDYINVTTAAPDKGTATINKVAVVVGNKTYTVNGKEFTLDSAPVKQNDRVLVPTRAISDGLGYQVIWDDATQTATVVSGDNRTASFTVGSNVVKVNGVPTITMDVTPVITAEDRMLVPFRALGEALGIKVEWLEATQTATYN